ncbi:MAG: hypothetical protein CMI00_11600 [Oceanospirillaceae bacterium]|nr:hypothetical protein [Oceanospirillaceae bacterium]
MAELISGQSKELGGFSVTRLLPSKQRRMVGPFVFLDHMGPADFAPGDGIDVRPHPHIGLSTLSYLFEGAMLHRDSLGNQVEIFPGDVNWMTAGRGIVHSERESHEAKAGAHRMDGLQFWVALPEADAETEPAFSHHNRHELPVWNREGVFARLLAGEALGMSSPVRTFSPMFALDVLMQKGTSLPRPNPEQECAAYIIDGAIRTDEQSFSAGDLIVLDAESGFSATANTRLFLFGGDHWPKTPHLVWNFVSFSTERIKQASEDWKAGRFPAIPGDDLEHIPLPE